MNHSNENSLFCHKLKRTHCITRWIWYVYCIYFKWRRTVSGTTHFNPFIYRILT